MPTIIIADCVQLLPTMGMKLCLNILEEETRTNGPMAPLQELCELINFNLQYVCILI